MDAANVNTTPALDEIDALLADEALESVIEDTAGADEIEEVVVADDAEDDLEALLADESDEAPAEEAAAEVEPEADPEVSDEELAAVSEAVELEEMRREAYEEQESKVEITEPIEAPAPSETESKSTPKTRAATTRVARNIADIDADNFVLDVSEVNETFDAEANKKNVLASRPSAKKVGEKFDNALGAIAAGKLPSVYTMIAIRLLNEKGEFTSKDLVSRIMSTEKAPGVCYGEGTARAQAAQMTQLLPVLKIATKDGNKLTRNPNSTLLMAIEKIEGAGDADEEAASEE